MTLKEFLTAEWLVPIGTFLGAVILLLTRFKELKEKLNELSPFKDKEKIIALKQIADLEFEKLNLQVRITELEKAVLEGKKWEDFVNKCIVPCCSTTPEGRIIWVNEAFLSEFGYEKGELENQRITTFYHKEDINRAAEQRRRLAEGFLIKGFEARFLCENGTYKKAAWYSSINGVVYSVAVILD